MVIETERLILRAMNEEDENEVVKWRNDKEVTDSLFSDAGVTLSEHRQWFERYQKGRDRIEYIIINKSTGRKIGSIGLSGIDNRNRKAEYGILIGEKDEWGKGYSYEASIAILQYGFKELDLQKIYLRVFEDNYAAVKLYERLGFLLEGTLRQDILKNGNFKNVLMMSILRNEWSRENIVW